MSRGERMLSTALSARVAEIERLRETLAITASALGAAERERDEARAEVERLREALTDIERWSQAYPLTVFPEPDFKRARELLEAGGMTLDGISAWCMRHVVEGVGEISRVALAEQGGGDAT